MLGDPGGELRAPAAVVGVLVDDHELARLAQRFHDGFVIEGKQRAGIDDLAVDALLRELGGGLLGLVAHKQVGDYRDVLPFPPDRGLTERNGIIPVGNLTRGVERSRLFSL